MSRSKKKSAEETFLTIAQQAEVDRIVGEVRAMSDEEVAKELADAGIDIEEEIAKWRALKKKLDDQDAAKAKRRATRRWVLLLAAALGILVLVLLGRRDVRTPIADPRVRAPNEPLFVPPPQKCIDCPSPVMPALPLDAGR
jgi:hypothetical protein